MTDAYREHRGITPVGFIKTVRSLLLEEQVDLVGIMPPPKYCYLTNFEILSRLILHADQVAMHAAQRTHLDENSDAMDRVTESAHSRGDGISFSQVVTKIRFFSLYVIIQFMLNESRK